MAAADWARGARVEIRRASLAERAATAAPGPSGRRPRRSPAPACRGAADRPTDPAREAAYEALRAVHRDDAYANLVLPG